jgi:hypothetical protein
MESNAMLIRSAAEVSEALCRPVQVRVDILSDDVVRLKVVDPAVQCEWLTKAGACNLIVVREEDEQYRVELNRPGQETECRSCHKRDLLDLVFALAMKTVARE